MTVITYAIFFSLVGGLFSLIGAIFLISNRGLIKRLNYQLLGFAAGAMMAATFFDIIPEALLHNDNDTGKVLIWIIFGFIIFYIIESIFLWFHHHHQEEFEFDEPIDTKKVHSHAPVLLTIGDSLHNFLDGIAIGSAFLGSIPLGIVTSIAVAAHEIPSEMGDFIIMLNGGWSKKKVILANIFSSLLSTIGVLFVFIITAGISGILLAMTAGFFIYIGIADLLPEIYRQGKKGKFTHMLVFFIVGFMLIALISVNLVGLPE